MIKNSLEAFGYRLDPGLEEFYSKNRKTHNSGVFRLILLKLNWRDMPELSQVYRMPMDEEELLGTIEEWLFMG